MSSSAVEKSRLDRWQRTLDLIGLLLWSPPFIVGFPIVWFLVRWNLGAPVLFKQVRPGKDGRLFAFYKFRSMMDARDAQGRLLPDEHRLTPFGAWLRRSSLDELPQILNVIKGDISLVGPRPLVADYLPLYSTEQRRRLDVRPGITGWAQINGRNSVSWDEKFRLDVWYVDHRSLRLYFDILFKSIGKILKKENISSGRSVTMEPFRGSKSAEDRSRDFVSESQAGR